MAPSVRGALSAVLPAAIRFERDGAASDDVDLVRTVCRLDSGDNFNSRPEGRSAEPRGRRFSIDSPTGTVSSPISPLVAGLGAMPKRVLLSVSRVRFQAIPS
jgi:hypothetical protein